MKVFKSSILLFLVLAACQTENTEIVYDNSEAVYLNLEKTFVLHEDGSKELRVEKKQKLLSLQSFHSLYGQTDIYYNPEQDSVVVEVAETKTPEGDIVPVPDKGYVDMIPAYARGAEQFSHHRHKAVLHTALEIGAIIHSKYTIFSKPGSSNTLMGHELLTQDCPVENYKIIVKIPKNQELDFNSINIDEDPKVSKKGGYKIYTWQISNIEQISEEEFSPRYNAGKKQILFSSADSLFPVFNEFTSQKAFTFETSIGMREALLDRLSNEYSTFEKLGTLQEIVINEIKTLPIPLATASYQIKPAISTWESMAGTYEEKAILLTAMIRSLGLRAIPVASIPSYLITKDSVLRPVGNLDLLAFYLVQVPVDGNNHYIDVRSKQMIDPIAKLQNHVIVPLEMGYSKVHLNPSPKLEFQLSWDGNVVLNSSGQFNGWMEGNYIGQMNPFLGLKLDPESIKSLYPGETIIDVTSPRSTMITFTSNLEDYVTTLGNKTLIELPLNETGIGSWGMNTLGTNRKTAVHLPSAVREFQRLIVALPRGFHAVNFLTDVTKTNDLGRVSIRYTQKNGKYEVLRNLNINTAIIEPEQFNLLKELLDPWFDTSMKRMLVEPTPGIN